MTREEREETHRILSYEEVLKQLKGCLTGGEAEYNYVKLHIDSIPLITPYKWIPVSDGLPKAEQEILFSTKTGRVHSGKYYDDNSANQWYSHRDKCRAWNNVVTAWMPLPEPYKGESEEKE